MKKKFEPNTWIKFYMNGATCVAHTGNSVKETFIVLNDKSGIAEMDWETCSRYSPVKLLFKESVRELSAPEKGLEYSLSILWERNKNKNIVN